MFYLLVENLHLSFQDAKPAIDIPKELKMLQALLPHTTVTASSLNSQHTGLTHCSDSTDKEETLSHTDRAPPH